MSTRVAGLLVFLLCLAPLAFGQAPTITSISPISVVAAVPAFTLTVNGSGFDSSSVLVWNTVPQTITWDLITTLVSPSQLTAFVSATLIQNSGSVSVQVENIVSGKAFYSNTVTFTMTAPVPVITSVSPSAAAAGSAGVSFVLHGTGLIPSSTAYWNSVSLGSSYFAGSSTAPPQLTVWVPASLLMTVGTATITVVNPGNPTPSNGLTFTVIPPVVVTGISPTSVSMGGPDLTLTVNGTGFAPGAVVSAGETNPYLFIADFVTTFVSDTKLTAIVPAWTTANAGQFQIYVKSGGVSAGGLYLAITGLTPVITGTSWILAGAANLQVNGTGFANGAVVSWAGTALATIVYPDYTPMQADVTVPNSLQTIGAWGITITDPGGVPSNVYTVYIPPGLTAITPSAAAAGSPNLTISIAGDFRSGSVAYLAGSGSPVALATSFVSSTTLSAVIPASLLTAVATYSLYVLDPSGAKSSPVGFAVSPPPSLGSISPATSVAGKSVSPLTVSGSGFAPACVVEASATALNTTYSSSSLLTATVPASLLASAGTVAITVVCTGVSSNSAALTITAPSPAITTISPIATNAGGPTFTLAVSGSNFVPGSVVQWNGAALSTTYQNAGSLAANVPAALTAIAGTYNVTVANPNGAVAPSVGFQVDVVLSNVTPNSAPAGSPNLTVTLTGVGFPTSAAVWLGIGSSALVTTYLNSTTLTAAIPATLLAQPLQTFITVEGPGLWSPRLSFTITGTPVTITSLLPSTITAGGPAFTLTVNGSGFVSGATVQWNSTVLATTFVGAGQLTAAVPAALITNTGAVSIVVAVPAGTPSPSATYYVNGPAATLSSLSPNSALPAGAAFTLTLNGSEFYPGATVWWNGQTPLQTTFVSSTVLTAAVPASLIAGAGAAQVSVRNYGGVASTNTLGFTIAGSVTISSLNQTSVAAGSAGFNLIVSGAGFGSTAGFLSVVEWNGTPLATTVNSSVSLVAAVPASLLVTVGSVTITVATASFVSNGIAFTITEQVPQITGLNPASANAGAAAFTLSVTGSGFVSASVVSWAGTPLATIFVSASTLTASIPASFVVQSGSFNIVVTNPGGVVSNAATFGVGAIMTAIMPASVPTGNSDVTVTVTGTGFQAGSVLNIRNTTTGYSSTLSTTYVSPTTLTAVIPALWLLSPQNAVIGLASSASQLVFTIGAPSISSLDPASVTAGTTSFTLSVNGAGFTNGGSTVQWNGGALTTTFVSAAKLAAAVPGSLAANPGSAAITVTNGVLSNSVAFTIAPPGGSITAISPIQAAAGGPAFTLTVNGSGFTAASVVEWNGSALATTFVNANQLTAAVPANLLGGAGTATITVVTAGQVSPSVTFTIASSSQSPSITNIGNAASYTTSIAPGSLISIFGSNLAASEAQPGGAPLPTTLANTSVAVNGSLVPLMYADAGQINAQVPFETPTGTASVVVQSGALQSPVATIFVIPTGPGVLNDPATGHAVAQNQVDWSVNSPVSPVQRGQYLIVYLTGQGLLDNPIATGAAASADPLSRPLAPVQATIGGQTASVAFAGMTPGFVGLFQVNLLVPNVAQGEQPLSITVGSAAANQTTVSVQ